MVACIGSEYPHQILQCTSTSQIDNNHFVRTIGSGPGRADNAHYIYWKIINFILIYRSQDFFFFCDIYCLPENKIKVPN